MHEPPSAKSTLDVKSFKNPKTARITANWIFIALLKKQWSVNRSEVFVQQDKTCIYWLYLESCISDKNYQFSPTGPIIINRFINSFSLCCSKKKLCVPFQQYQLQLFDMNCTIAKVVFIHHRYLYDNNLMANIRTFVISDIYRCLGILVNTFYIHFV